jgi:sarcosine oxidase gamma subunit
MAAVRPSVVGLQVVEHFVRVRYFNSTPDHQNILREFLCSWSRNQVGQARVVRYGPDEWEIVQGSLTNY